MFRLPTNADGPQVQLLPAELAQLREQIDQYAGPNGPNLGIAMTETESNYDSDTQPGALFNADVYFTTMENGAFTVDYSARSPSPATHWSSPDQTTR